VRFSIFLKLFRSFYRACFYSEGKANKKKEKEKERDGKGRERGKGRDDLPYDLGNLEMTWLLSSASAATAYTGPPCQG